MTPVELQAAILAGPLAAECAAHVHTNDMPKIGGAEAMAKDQTIADLLNASGLYVEPVSYRITELGVRDHLSMRDSAYILRFLREIAATPMAPDWLTAILSAQGVPAEDHWVYLDTLQCAWTWLRSDGLEVGSEKTRSLLDLIAAGNPPLISACSALKALGTRPIVITAADVSRALRGPWE